MIYPHLTTCIFGAERNDIDMNSVWHEIDMLTAAHESEIMHLLFDRDGQPTGRTLKAIGNIIGVTPERARQIREKVYRRLRNGVRIKRYKKRPQDVGQVTGSYYDAWL